jgi:hypothetical protein
VRAEVEDKVGLVLETHKLTDDELPRSLNRKRQRRCRHGKEANHDEDKLGEARQESG